MQEVQNYLLTCDLTYFHWYIYGLVFILVSMNLWVNIMYVEFIDFLSSDLKNWNSLIILSYKTKEMRDR